MDSQTARGFTIIETMLFLAITGALTVGILVGSGTAIARQRYRDSVSSLKAFVQDQYSETVNVVNSELQNSSCRAGGSGLVLDSSDPQLRGTSKCLLLGRYVLIEPSNLTAYNVLGQPGTESEGDDDIEALQNYILRSSDVVDSKEVAWGATIVSPGTTNGLTTSVLILRSPLSGSVVTFVRAGNHQPADMLNADFTKDKNDLCVESGSSVVTGQRLAVRINANATGQSSIEIPLEGDTSCGR